MFPICLYAISNSLLPDFTARCIEALIQVSGAKQSVPGSKTQPQGEKQNWSLILTTWSEYHEAAHFFNRMKDLWQGVLTRFPSGPVQKPRTPSCSQQNSWMLISPFRFSQQYMDRSRHVLDIMNMADRLFSLRVWHPGDKPRI